MLLSCTIINYGGILCEYQTFVKCFFAIFVKKCKKEVRSQNPENGGINNKSACGGQVTQITRI
jgi:hypothetical protein